MAPNASMSPSVTGHYKDTSKATLERKRRDQINDKFEILKSLVNKDGSKMSQEDVLFAAVLYVCGVQLEMTKFESLGPLRNIKEIKRRREEVPWGRAGRPKTLRTRPGNGRPPHCPICNVT
uniref:BHLH domain-containing protein n=1 Tax=Caenorhabditis japonica TaxID=281687 RepID=A0A8R1IHE6_CAEJA